MKKIISLFFVAGMLSLISCGPSKEELKAREQAKQDSIAKVEAATAAKAKASADSIAKVQAVAAKQKATADSIAEAAKKPAKGGKVVKPTTPVKPVVKDNKEAPKKEAPKTGKGGRK